MKFVFYTLAFVTFFSSLFSQSHPLIAKGDYIKMCDLVYNNDLELHPEKVFEGAIVYVRSSSLKKFFARVFPKIEHRFALLSFGDRGSPREFAPYLDDPKLIAWFGVNPTHTTHKKFFPLPIGIANQIEDDLLTQTAEKEYLLYFNMTIEANQANKWKQIERNEVFSLFAGKKYCFCSERKPYAEYLSDLKKSSFVLSPRGNGLDCYRTWEALAMGAIPIVKTSSLDPLFEDLPVLIVTDWSALNKKSLQKKLNEINQKQVNLEKLSRAYWVNMIEEVMAKAGIDKKITI